MSAPAAATPERPFGWPRRAAIAAGVVVLALLWLGPLPAWSETAFSIHMVLHLGVIVIAAPLLAFGLAPLLPPLTEARSALSWGVLASVADMVIVWGWHAPLLHAAAALHPPLLALQQVSFLAVGLGVWTVAFNSTTRASLGIAALVLFLTFMHMSMFGLVITLAPQLLYAPSLCLGAFGFAGIDDQRLGGILMAVCGGLPYLFGTAWIAYRFLSDEPEPSVVGSAST